MPKAAYYRLVDESIQLKWKEELITYFLKKKLKDIRINEIILILGIGKSRFYNYFEGLEDVYLYIYEYITKPLTFTDGSQIEGIEDITGLIKNEVLIGNKNWDILHYIMIHEMKSANENKIFQAFIEKNRIELENKITNIFYKIQRLNIVKKNTTVEDILYIILISRVMIYEYIQTSEYDEIDIPGHLNYIFSLFAFGVLKENKLNRIIYSRLMKVLVSHGNF